MTVETQLSIRPSWIAPTSTSKSAPSPASRSSIKTWIDGQIDAAATVDAARAAAFEAMQTRSQAGAGLRTHATDRDGLYGP